MSLFVLTFQSSHIPFIGKINLTIFGQAWRQLMFQIKWDTWQKLDLQVDIIETTTSSVVSTLCSLQTNTVVREKNIAKIELDLDLEAAKHHHLLVKVINHLDRFPDGRPRLYCPLFEFSHGDVIKFLPCPSEGATIICEVII